MSGPEKRLGKRQSTPDITIGWRTDHEARKGLRMKPDPQEGLIVDLSVTGAGVLAPTADDLRPGMRVKVSFRGEDGSVIVRRVSPTTDPAVTRYGVSFQDFDQRLLNAVNAVLAESRPDSLDDFWKQAP